MNNNIHQGSTNNVNYVINMKLLIMIILHILRRYGNNSKLLKFTKYLWVIINAKNNTYIVDAFKIICLYLNNFTIEISSDSKDEMFKRKNTLNDEINMIRETKNSVLKNYINEMYEYNSNNNIEASEILLSFIVNQIDTFKNYLETKMNGSDIDIEINLSVYLKDNKNNNNNNIGVLQHIIENYSGGDDKEQSIKLTIDDNLIGNNLIDVKIIALLLYFYKTMKKFIFSCQVELNLDAKNYKQMISFNAIIKFITAKISNNTITKKNIKIILNDMLLYIITKSTFNSLYNNDNNDVIKKKKILNIQNIGSSSENIKTIVANTYDQIFPKIFGEYNEKMKEYNETNVNKYLSLFILEKNCEFTTVQKIDEQLFYNNFSEENIIKNNDETSLTNENYIYNILYTHVDKYIKEINIINFIDVIIKNICRSINTDVNKKEYDEEINRDKKNKIAINYFVKIINNSIEKILKNDIITDNIVNYYIFLAKKKNITIDESIEKMKNKIKIKIIDRIIINCLKKIMTVFYIEQFNAFGYIKLFMILNKIILDVILILYKNSYDILIKQILLNMVDKNIVDDKIKNNIKTTNYDSNKFNYRLKLIILKVMLSVVKKQNILNKKKNKNIYSYNISTNNKLYRQIYDFIFVNYYNQSSDINKIIYEEIECLTLETFCNTSLKIFDNTAIKYTTIGDSFELLYKKLSQLNGNESNLKKILKSKFMMSLNNRYISKLDKKHMRLYIPNTPNTLNINEEIENNDFNEKYLISNNKISYLKIRNNVIDVDLDNNDVRVKLYSDNYKKNGLLMVKYKNDLTIYYKKDENSVAIERENDYTAESFNTYRRNGNPSVLMKQTNENERLKPSLPIYDMNNIGLVTNKDNPDYYDLKKYIEDEHNYSDSFIYGPFTRIFGPTANNKQIADECVEIIGNLMNYKSVFVLGLGPSGAGKTSTLIYFNKGDKPDETNGIIINILQNKNILDTFPNGIILNIKEVSSYSQINDSVVDKVNDVKFFYNDITKDYTLSKQCDEKNCLEDEQYNHVLKYISIEYLISVIQKNINANIKTLKEKCNLKTCKVDDFKLLFEKMPIDVKFDGSKIELSLKKTTSEKSMENQKTSEKPTKILETNVSLKKNTIKRLASLINQQKKRNKKTGGSLQEFTSLLRKCIFNIYEIKNDKNEVIITFSGTSLGNFLVFMNDVDRMIKATTNNVNSSRSHVLSMVKFIGTPVYLIVGDFAGMENIMSCDSIGLKKLYNQPHDVLNGKFYTKNMLDNETKKYYKLEVDIKEFNKNNGVILGGVPPECENTYCKLIENGDNSCHIIASYFIKEYYKGPKYTGDDKNTFYQEFIDFTYENMNIENDYRILLEKYFNNVYNFKTKKTNNIDYFNYENCKIVIGNNAIIDDSVSIAINNIVKLKTNIDIFFANIPIVIKAMKYLITEENNLIINKKNHPGDFDTPEKIMDAKFDKIKILKNVQNDVNSYAAYVLYVCYYDKLITEEKISEFYTNIETIKTCSKLLNDIMMIYNEVIKHNYIKKAIAYLKIADNEVKNGLLTTLNFIEENFNLLDDLGKTNVLISEIHIYFNNITMPILENNDLYKQISTLHDMFKGTEKSVSEFRFVTQTANVIKGNATGTTYDTKAVNAVNAIDSIIKIYDSHDINENTIRDKITLNKSNTSVNPANKLAIMITNFFTPVETNNGKFIFKDRISTNIVKLSKIINISMTTFNNIISKTEYSNIKNYMNTYNTISKKYSDTIVPAYIGKIPDFLEIIDHNMKYFRVESCKLRQFEGYGINNLVNNTTDYFKYKFTSANKSLFNIPNFFELCHLKYCDYKTNTCFNDKFKNLEAVKPNLYKSYKLIHEIYKVIEEDENVENKNEFMDKLVYCIFAVINISPGALDPPKIMYTYLVDLEIEMNKYVHISKNLKNIENLAELLYLTKKNVNNEMYKDIHDQFINLINFYVNNFSFINVEYTQKVIDSLKNKFKLGELVIDLKDKNMDTKILAFIDKMIINSKNIMGIDANILFSIYKIIVKTEINLADLGKDNVGFNMLLDKNTNDVSNVNIKVIKNSISNTINNMMELHEIITNINKSTMIGILDTVQEFNMDYLTNMSCSCSSVSNDIKNEYFTDVLKKKGIIEDKYNNIVNSNDISKYLERSNFKNIFTPIK